MRVAELPGQNSVVTSNLDGATGDAIIGLFRLLNVDGLTIIAVTHSAALADATDRRLRLQDGRLIAG